MPNSSAQTQTGGPSLASRLQESATAIAQKLSRSAPPRLVVVLGSGFKGFEQNLRQVQTLAFADIPHFPVPKVEGHGAALVVGSLNGVDVAVLTGRVHLYEGWTPDEVVYAIRALGHWGSTDLLLTNASGSVDPNIPAASIVLASDQLNLTGRNCLAGSDGGLLGPRFVDMGTVYDREWRQRLKDQAKAKNWPLREGVYAGLLGPAYETPAETRMLGRLGANIVGMSTVQEAMAARQLGMRVLVLAFVTNMAGGLGGDLTHDDVIAQGKNHQSRLHDMLALAIATSQP